MSKQIHFQGGEPFSESVYVTMGNETLTIGCHQGKDEALKADACLIAAAPELLEALKQINHICGTTNYSSYDQMKEAIEGAVELSDIAIAKATGG